MNVVIAGGGMVGLTLGRLLQARGLEPIIIERMPAGAYIPRGYMLGFQGYE
ncbi:MAG: FAD-dependent oxidoreductase, partial [Miltoncostaeaceae bacterium]